MTEEIVKVCKVHGDLEKCQTYLDKNWDKRYNKYYMSLLCKLCKLDSNKRSYIRNKEKRLAGCKKYYLKNRDTYIKRSTDWYKKNLIHSHEIQKKYRESHKEEISLKCKLNKNSTKRYRENHLYRLRHRQRSNEWNKKDRELMSEGYIKSLFHEKRAADLPDWLIKLKRVEISIKRKLRENYDKECS